MKKLRRDGATFAYVEAGHGAPPVILLHGLACDHTFFAPQAEHLSRDHRVISVDLRGHGQSDRPEGVYSAAEYADDVAWLCKELDAARPVLMGHSVGGLIAFEVARRHPQLPSAVISLDAPLLLPPPVREHLGQLARVLRTEDHQAAMRNFSSVAQFLPTDPPDIKKRILDVMSTTPQHVKASTMEQLVALDTEEAVAACQVPALAIYADAPFDVEPLRKLCPQLKLGRTVGAGHFHQLIVPDQINAMVDRFLAITGRAPAST